MRMLEVRRHAMRNKPGEHLSRQGIALAQLEGAKTGPFDWVVTSPSPRAVETAVAMGFAVDETWQELFEMDDGVFSESGWPAPFTALQEKANYGRQCASFAAAQAKVWQRVVQKIRDGEQALIVSHGLFIEMGAIACLPHARHADWGDPIGYCEGFRLTFDGDSFIQGDMLRVPPDYYLVEN